MTESLRRADRGSRVAHDLHPGQRKREQEREQAPGLGTSHEGTKWPRRHARAVVYPLRTVGRVREDRESYFAGSALDQVLCRGRSAWACQSSSLSAANRGAVAAWRHPMQTFASYAMPARFVYQLHYVGHELLEKLSNAQEHASERKAYAGHNGRVTAVDGGLQPGPSRCSRTTGE